MTNKPISCDYHDGGLSWFISSPGWHDMLDVRVEQPRSYKSYTDTCTNKQIAPSFLKKKCITLLGASDSIVLLGDCTSMAEEIILRNKLWENREVTGKKKNKNKKKKQYYPQNDELCPPAQLQLCWYQQRLMQQMSYSLFLHLDRLMVS